jgi:hypothetical protein
MRLAKFVKFRVEKFGGVLFETRSEKVYTLNPTACAIVAEFDAGGGVEGIASRLTDRFTSANGTLEREVAAFVGDLRARGLVED